MEPPCSSNVISTPYSDTVVSGTNHKDTEFDDKPGRTCVEPYQPSRKRSREVATCQLEEFQCAICLELMVDPVTLVCGHTLDRWCLKRYFQSAPPSPVCPICRRKLGASSHVPEPCVLLQNVILHLFPEEYARRKTPEYIACSGQYARLQDIRMRMDDAQAHAGQGQVLEKCVLCETLDMARAEDQGVVEEALTLFSSMLTWRVRSSPRGRSGCFTEDSECTVSAPETIFQQEGAVEVLLGALCGSRATWGTKRQCVLLLSKLTVVAYAVTFGQAGVFGKECLREAGVVQALVEFLKQWPAPVERAVCVHSIMTLRVIATGPPECKASLVQAGALLEVIRHVKMCEDQLEQLEPAGVLRNVAAGGLDCKRAVCSAGGVEALSSLVRIGDGLWSLQVEVANALGDLATGDTACKAAVVAGGGVKALVRLLEASTDISKTQAAMALQAVVEDHPEGQLAVVREGGVPSLARIIQHHEGSAQMAAVCIVAHVMEGGCECHRAMILQPETLRYLYIMLDDSVSEFNDINQAYAATTLRRLTGGSASTLASLVHAVGRQTLFSGIFHGSEIAHMVSRLILTQLLASDQREMRRLVAPATMLIPHMQCARLWKHSDSALTIGLQIINCVVTSGDSSAVVELVREGAIELLLELIERPSNTQQVKQVSINVLQALGESPLTECREVFSTPKIANALHKLGIAYVFKEDHVPLKVEGNATS
ncbi:hypothetical protein CYMTET_37660 [Cymbomonas tetramitiformis]|uniref:RING-type E3 ubiquitin transferase n=1 Tax=Cymbomonas tetramitiformis TaxID=36881 RepID=A0AAE0CET5_9CHLO|nr:hypothetical protein CYMTET_37660 [Cymbomonas tetramitiformis]